MTDFELLAIWSIGVASGVLALWARVEWLTVKLREVESELAWHLVAEKERRRLASPGVVYRFPRRGSDEAA